jgi:deferrochelatase/peroxidase EfeB
MSTKNWDRVPIDAQSIDAPLSRAAVFLVVTVANDLIALTKVCSALDGLDDLVKTVGFRDLAARLSCIVGIGCSLWDRLHFDKKPLELRPFMPIKGAVHVAPSTPGDLLFHIRAERPDLCFEFERILLDSLGTGVTVVDEVSCFRYFDARDLLGFVDGTANPTSLDLPASALVSDEDVDFLGGSYASFRNIYTISARGRRFQHLFRRRSLVEQKQIILKLMTTLRRANRTSHWRPLWMPAAMNMIYCATTCHLVVRGNASSARIL